MKAAISTSTLVAVFALLTASTARADEYDDTIAIFKGAGQSASFFAKSYGYAVFPQSAKAAWAWVPRTAADTSTRKASM